jgi:type I restriction enzyme S subunit
MRQEYDRSWPLVKFGDMAQNVTDRVDPAEADGDVYVGLEHLDAESLKIRRWGTPADVIGQKLRFRKGDIIFGKRRAYQRKLAVAECNGICSAHAMVVRAKPKVVLPGFLPFLMQSDLFMDRAVEISVGSLSPTINWKTLKVQEFPLPPLDEQRRLAELLWAADEVVEAWREALVCVDRLADGASYRIFAATNRHTRTASVPELCDQTTVGIVVRPAKWYVDEGVPALRSLNVWPDRFDLSELVELSQEGHEQHEKSRLKTGDVVIVRTGRPGDAAVIPTELDGYNAIDLILCRPGASLDPHYLSRYLNSAAGRRQLEKGTAGTAQKHFNVGSLKKLRIPVLPVEEQRAAVSHLAEIDDRRAAIARHIGRVQSLRNGLLASVMGNSA